MVTVPGNNPYTYTHTQMHMHTHTHTHTHIRKCTHRDPSKLINSFITENSIKPTVAMCYLAYSKTTKHAIIIVSVRATQTVKHRKTDFC